MSHFCKVAMAFGRNWQFPATVFRAEFRGRRSSAAIRTCSACPRRHVASDTCLGRDPSFRPRRRGYVREFCGVPRASFLFRARVADPVEWAFFDESIGLPPARGEDEIFLEVGRAWGHAA